MALVLGWQSTAGAKYAATLAHSHSLVLSLTTKEVPPPPPRVPATIAPSAPVPPKAPPSSTSQPTKSTKPTTQSDPTKPSQPKSDPLKEVKQLSGISINAPQQVTMGDAFVIVLNGQSAANTTVRFISESREDVRFANEVLHPIGAAGAYRVLGRAVLGKTTPLVYEVNKDNQVVRGTIKVANLPMRAQYLNLPPSLTKARHAPQAKQEAALMEKLYTLRTPQLWTRPFVFPLANHSAISSHFGQARTYSVGSDLEYHYGSDYPAPKGTPVRAINDGKVMVAANYPLRGGLVVLDHGAGLLSLYFHMSKIAVKKGQSIERSHKIGEVGSTGLSGGPHLHLEMRVRGEAVNPLLWMQRIWPAR